MRQVNVFPECYVDTNLMVFLLGCAVKHKSTCNEVVKAVNRANVFAIGVIDADKRLATMDAGFVKYQSGIEADGTQQHVTMYLHEDGRRYLFTIKPAIEKFILDAAKEQHVDLPLAGFPTGVDEFKKRTKSIQAATDIPLRRLFDQIKDNPELQRFRNTLKYLINNQHNAKPEVTKQFFVGTLDKEDLLRYLPR